MWSNSLSRKQSEGDPRRRIKKRRKLRKLRRRRKIRKRKKKRNKWLQLRKRRKKAKLQQKCFLFSNQYLNDTQLKRYEAVCYL